MRVLPKRSRMRSNRSLFALKGSTIPRHQKRDCRPYLNEAQASELIRDVLDKYQALSGLTPSRIVVHRTGTCQPEEELGFRAIANSRVPACELVRIQSLYASSEKACRSRGAVRCAPSATNSSFLRWGTYRGGASTPAHIFLRQFRSGPAAIPTSDSGLWGSWR